VAAFIDSGCHPELIHRRADSRRKRYGKMHLPLIHLQDFTKLNDNGLARTSHPALQDAPSLERDGRISGTEHVQWHPGVSRPACGERIEWAV
jgi:hypothetical protein